MSILCLMSIICVFMKRGKKINVYILIMGVGCITWRYLYGITSGRYCSALLVCAFLVVIPFFKKKRVIKCFLAAIVIAYQAVKCFSGYNNMYINNIKDIITDLTNNNKAVLIDEDEFNRLSIRQNNYSFEYKQQPLSITSVLNDFFYWNDYIYLVMRGVGFYDVSKEADAYSSVPVTSFKTGRNNKRISLYRLKNNNRMIPQINGGNDLINNGNIERLASYSTTVQEFKKWIESGATFYKNSHIKLPSHSILLPYWSVPSSLTYPIVYASAQAPIEGDYSLRVCFFQESHLFLMNMIKKNDGLLSFDIRNNHLKSYITIRMSYYKNDNSWIDTKSVINYHIPLHDNEVRHYDISINENQFVSDKALFEIHCNIVDFSIDNISFYAY